jgi:WD40 repeat protein
MTNQVPVLKTYEGHRDYVFAVAWSPDGVWAASGGRDRTVHVWQAETLDTIQIFLAHDAYVLSVSWSPDSRYLASGCTNGVVYVWEAATGRIVTTYHQHVRFVRSLSWSPDGVYIASGGDYGDSSVRVWEAFTGKTLIVRNDQYRIFAACWSPAGTAIASGSFDGKLHVWSPFTTPQSSYIAYEEQGSPLYAVDWSPDTALLASAGEEGVVRLYATSSQQIVCTYCGHHAAIKALAWAAQRGYIASGGDDKTVQIWSPSSGTQITSLTAHQSWVRTIAWSPDSHIVASASDKTVQLWYWDEKLVL